MKAKVNNSEVFISTGGRVFDSGSATGGAVLLFIHGSGQSHLSFALQSRYFANRGWQVLAPSMPGHYLSEGTPLESIETMADWHAEVLRAMGVKEAIVIGHSQGGLISLELAKRHEGLVKKVVILASAMAIPVNKALLDMAEHDEPKAFASMVSWSHGVEGHRFVHSVPGQSHTGTGFEIMARNRAGVLATDLHACNNYTAGAEAASGLTCPVFCVLAGGDKMVPAKFGKQLAEAVADGGYRMIEGAGHFLPSEHAIATNAIMRPFLEQ